MFGKKKTEESHEITCSEAQEFVSKSLDDLFQTLVQRFNKEILDRAKCGYSAFSESLGGDRFVVLADRLEAYYKDRGFSVTLITQRGFMGCRLFSLGISWETEDIKKLLKRLWAEDDKKEKSDE